jgi:tetratricopeptide (TPR) repeat protein
MRPNLIKAIVLMMVILTIVGIWAASRMHRPDGDSPAAYPVSPTILRVGPGDAVIAWSTPDAMRGEVHYRPAGSTTDPLVAVEKLARSYRHEVTLTGLQPGRRYTYWIDSPERRFQFQTQPNANAPFSFLITNGQDTDAMARLVMDEIPDFVLDLSIGEQVPPDRFARVNAYQPVYALTGTVGNTADDATVAQPIPRRLDWGGLTLDILMAPQMGDGGLPHSTAHTRGVVLAQPPPELAVDGPAPDADAIRSSAVHRHLVTMSTEQAPQPAFVVFPAAGNWQARVDGIEYATLPPTADQGAVRMDIDVGSATAVFLDGGRRVALKKPPLKRRMTCEECRRLADRGTYEAAIEAYRAFIDNNAGHFQVDDAIYAVAEILDEKLFRFADALDGYHRLVRDYPQGTLAPLARQRIDYIEAYADHGFKPLAAFERIRKIDFARNQDHVDKRRQTLADVEALIDAYPDCRLAPTMQYWLAAQYRSDDPDRAVAAFGVLKKRYPMAPEAREAALHIADTLYAAARYSDARTAYQTALAELPDLADAIDSQIRRCSRNLRRDALAICAGALLAASLILGLMWPPLGLDLLQAGKALAVFGLLAVMIFGITWLIREQFTSPREMAALSVCLAGTAAAAGLFSGLLRQKWWQAGRGEVHRPRNVAPRLAGCLAGLVLLAAGIYLSVYLINAHYLVTVAL